MNLVNRARAGMRCLGLWFGTLSVAALLGGCPFGPDDPNCELLTDQQTDATALVKDPIVGEHQATLVWLETGQTTELTLTVDFDGPAIKGNEDCSGPYQVPVRTRAISADGLIDESGTQNEFVTAALRLPGESLAFRLAPASLLAAGVAPDQPDLAQKGASIALELARDASGWTKGTVRAFTADERVTLALITFGADS